MTTDKQELTDGLKKDRQVQSILMRRAALKIVQGIEKRELGSTFTLGVEVMTPADFRYRTSLVRIGCAEIAEQHNKMCAKLFGRVKVDRFSLQGDSARLMESKHTNRTEKILHDILNGVAQSDYKPARKE